VRTDQQVLDQIDRIIDVVVSVKRTWVETRFPHFSDNVALASLQAECSALADLIYGPDHPQAGRIKEAATGTHVKDVESVEGMLRGASEAIKHGLLGQLRAQILLDVQSDFVEAARAAVGHGAKDVAAALLCVVLEDACKRLGVKAGIPKIESMEFSQVVVALLSQGAITKSTKGALLAFRDLRNAALHAQWNEVSIEATQGLLYFLPGFLEQHGIYP